MLKPLFLCCALFALPGASLAGDAQAAACGDISVAFYENGALFYHDTAGAWNGIDKDVVAELARRLGCRFHSYTDSRVRIWTAMSMGSLDMAMSGVDTPEREAYARFVPYFVSHNYVLLKKDVAAQVHGLDDFLSKTDYRVGIIKSFSHGVVYEAWLAKLRAQGRVYEAADYPAVLNMLKIGRVQAILGMNTSWGGLLKQPAMAGRISVMDWAPHDVVTSALVLSRKTISDATAARFAAAIRAMRDDGTLKAIFERHVGPEIAATLLNP